MTPFNFKEKASLSDICFCFLLFSFSIHSLSKWKFCIICSHFVFNEELVLLEVEGYGIEEPETVKGEETALASEKVEEEQRDGTGNFFLFFRFLTLYLSSSLFESEINLAPFFLVLDISSCILVGFRKEKKKKKKKKRTKDKGQKYIRKGVYSPEFIPRLGSFLSFRFNSV